MSPTEAWTALRIIESLALVINEDTLLTDNIGRLNALLLVSRIYKKEMLLVDLEKHYLYTRKKY